MNNISVKDNTSWVLGNRVLFGALVLVCTGVWAWASVTNRLAATETEIVQLQVKQERGDAAYNELNLKIAQIDGKLDIVIRQTKNAP